MTRHEKLLENYEDALFALLMDEVAEQEGKRFLEENEQLRQNPEAIIPDEVNERCLKTIKRSFAKKRRREVSHSAYGIFTHIAVFSLAVVILVGTAYAAFPEMRIRTLNLMIEVSDVASSLSLVQEDSHSSDSNNETGITRDEKMLSGYRLPKIPSEFVIIDEVCLTRSSWIEYRNDLGNTIWISIDAATGMTVNRDTEEAQDVENIQIHGYDGLLIIKGDGIDITWGDTDQNNFITVHCTGINRATVLSYAESIEFVATP